MGIDNYGVVSTETKPFEEKKPQVNPNNNQEVGVESGASEISQHKQQQQQQQHAKSLQRKHC